MKSRKELLKEVESLHARIAELENTITRPHDSANLQESDARYQELFDSLMEGVGFVDENEVFQFCNPACVRIFEENSCEAMVGKSLLSYLPDDQVKLVRQETSQRGKGISSTYDLKIVTASGNHRFISVTASPQFDEVGKFTGTSSALLDITQRKQAEEALIASKEQFRRLVDQSPMSIQVMEPDGRTIQVNKAWEQLWGVTLDDLQGYNMLEDQQLECLGVMPYIKRGFGGEKVTIPVVQYDVLETLDTGTKPWVAATIYPVKSADGEISHVVLMHEDITDRKRAEEALRESEEKLRAFADTVSDVIYRYDPILNQYDFISPSIESHTGYTVEEISADPAGVVRSFSHPEDCERVFREVREHIALGPDIGPLVTEYRIIRKDGETIHVIDTKVIEFTPDGKLSRVSGVVSNITERKKTEEKLRHLSSVAEQCNEGMAQVDVDGNLEFVNRAFAQMHGYEPEELLGKSLSIFHTADQMLAVNEINRQVMDSGSFSGEVWHVRRDGTTFPTHMESSLLRDSDGKVIGLIGTMRDITERKRAEEALRESEARFRDVAQSTADWIWEVDAQGRYTYVSDGVEEVLGYVPEDLLGKTPFDLMSEKEAERVSRIFTAIAADKQPIVDLENLNIAKDGHEVYLLTNGVPILDDEGKLAGYRGVDKDITERKQVEEALREKTTMLDNILRSASDVAIATTDLDYRITYYNPMAEKLFGYSAAEVVGKTVLEMHTKENVSPKRFERVVEIVRQVGEYNYSITQETDEGVRELDSTVAGIFGPDGKMVGYSLFTYDITERKQAEEALRESEGRYRDLFDNASNLIQCVRPDGSFLYVNPAWRETLGYEEEEIANLSLFDIIHPDHKEHCLDIFERVQAGGTAKGVETVLVSKTGKMITVAGNSSCLFEDGKPVATRGIFIDITERKQAEGERERARKFMQTVIDGFPESLMVINHDYTIELANKAALKIMKGKDSADSCMKCHEASHNSPTPCTGTDDPCPLKHVFATKAPVTVEHTHYDIEGRAIAVEIVAAPIFDEEGEVIQVIETSRDITDRKEGEANRLRLSRAIEHAAETIVITDAEGTIQYANPAFERITGYTVKEAIGQNPRILKSDKHDDAFYKKLWETLLRGEEWRGEVINKKKDGTLFTEDVTISPVYDGDGKVVNYVAVKSDITEIRRLQTLESRAERLEIAGRIAGQVAHDFNNLLAPLVAYPEFIREELAEDHHCLTYLEQMEKAASQIADINQQLLTLGRRGHYNQEPLELNEIVYQVLQQMEETPKTLVCETQLAGDLLRIMGGSAQIGRVLLNLISNACDAMQNIGQITIMTENYYIDEAYGRYASVPRGEYVKLTITDTGSGISPDVLPTIFEPFITTKTTDKKRGSGLGLSVVDAVVKDHDGYIDVKSIVGEGTSFYLYFPVARQSITTVTPAEIVGGTETVLVVDDDVVQRDVSVQLLKKLGYEIDAVESGEKAINYIRNNPRDLLILDMVMPPGIDGAETYRQTLEINPKQKAIIVSGFAESERVDEALRLGAGAYIRKPLTLRTIAEAARRELNRVGASVSSE
ncbi:MAG: PAS domain S-box protein [candidate division Zixibacteria bacterium]|nr:PAS domain S-box protein [candidate division Zixibacteria bacterium]